MIALSITSVLLTISGLITDILSTQCYFPYISPMLGVKEPQSPPPEVIRNATDSGTSIAPSPPYYPYPYYCGGNPAIAVIQFTFKLLSSFMFIGVGLYMVQNGRKH
jgi:hypothetical protein